MTPDEAAARGRVGAHVRWSREPDRQGATAPARAAFMDRFLREVDPDGVLDPAERQIRAEHAMRAHMGRLALARQKKRKAATTRR